MCDFLLSRYSGTGFIPGSTDVGDVSWLTPTAQIHAACFPLCVPGHSWQITSCGRTTIARKGMLTAAKVLACTAIDLFEEPELLRPAREEFEKRTAGGYICPIEPGEEPKTI